MIQNMHQLLYEQPEDIAEANIIQIAFTSQIDAINTLKLYTLFQVHHARQYHCAFSSLVKQFAHKTKNLYCNRKCGISKFKVETYLNGPTPFNKRLKYMLDSTGQLTEFKRDFVKKYNPSSYMYYLKISGKHCFDDDLSPCSIQKLDLIAKNEHSQRLSNDNHSFNCHLMPYMQDIINQFSFDW
ncbi:Hypothetical_protein [Hexamita inflata]|uniref:Hypothetical_protein n=1 Tax=Hexamita inflata TaxID=28002 RepID=A0AA86V1W3_9EUKA|nr:Hypothetical protein HINF_LOCUS60691 [Hexamita inflata]